ncbi:MAG TPA: signal peptidase I [Terriglobales bacterium]|nr:signal peptidase I [Terriglobales bacterium]
MATTLSKPKPAEKPRPRKPDKKKETALEFLSSLAVVLVVGLFIITFIVQAFEIPSSSMEDTLLIGDHVFVNRIGYSPPSRYLGHLLPYHDPQDGDVVVFLHPAEPGLYVVKRVMGVPGDRIHLRDGVVYRNGKPLNEPYVLRNGSYNPYRDNFPAVPADDDSNITPEWRLTAGSHVAGEDLVVPPDSYFMMGDNRDVSEDSRYWGLVPRQNVIGRPLLTYWSFEESATQYLKNSAVDRISFIFHVIFHFFDQTRWGRMLRIVR